MATRTWTQQPSILTPSFKVYRATNQTISTDTDTKVSLDTVSLNNEGWFDTSTNYRHTPKFAGWWLYAAKAQIQALDTQKFHDTYLFQNGVSVLAKRTVSPATNSDLANFLFTTIEMNGSTDYVELFVRQDSSANKTLVGGVGFTFLMGFPIRRA